MAYLFVADWSNWIIPLVIFISHILIDYIKVEYILKSATPFTKCYIHEEKWGFG